MTVWYWNTREFNRVQEILTKEYINNKLLLATDNKRMTAWNWAAYRGKTDILPRVWEWAEEN